MVKLQEAKGQFIMTIPKLVIKKKGWKKGQKLIMQFDQNENAVLMEV